MDNVPNDIIRLIFSYLELKVLVPCSIWSKRYYCLVNDVTLWKEVTLPQPKDKIPYKTIIHKIARLGTQKLQLGTRDKASVELLQYLQEQIRENQLVCLDFTSVHYHRKAVRQPRLFTT
jgi:hypothetical protein